MNVDQIICELSALLEHRPVPPVVIGEFLSLSAESRGLKRSELLDILSQRLAPEFIKGEFQLDSCGEMASKFTSAAIEDCSSFVWEVYIAFDAGVFPSDDNGEELRTRPMIEALLAERKISPSRDV